MAARRMMLPDYGTVSMKGTQYYRTRVTDQQGRRVFLYARRERNCTRRNRKRSSRLRTRRIAAVHLQWRSIARNGC